jgi:hypothetical protein
MTRDEFRAHVTVGTKLVGYSTGKLVTVTAIGVSRFLYLDWGSKERVALITSYDANWQIYDGKD